MDIDLTKLDIDLANELRRACEALNECNLLGADRGFDNVICYIRAIKTDERTEAEESILQTAIKVQRILRNPDESRFSRTFPPFVRLRKALEAWKEKHGKSKPKVGGK